LACELGCACVIYAIIKRIIDIKTTWIALRVAQIICNGNVAAPTARCDAACHWSASVVNRESRRIVTGASSATVYWYYANYYVAQAAGDVRSRVPDDALPGSRLKICSFSGYICSFYKAAASIG